jgi:hypothetical protein
MPAAVGRWHGRIEAATIIGDAQHEHTVFDPEPDLDRGRTRVF